MAGCFLYFLVCNLINFSQEAVLISHPSGNISKTISFKSPSSGRSALLGVFHSLANFITYFENLNLVSGVFKYFLNRAREKNSWHRRSLVFMLLIG